MKKISTLLLLLCALILVGCGDVQSEYYEVHVIVVDNQPFYYIDPSDGKDTFSANQLGTGETLFIYLYESVDGTTFSYDQYFSAIQERFVETNVKNGKLYVLSSKEIDNLITQFYLDKFEWESNHSN